MPFVKGKPSPLKGIPRSQWKEITAQNRAMKQAQKKAEKELLASIPTLTSVVPQPVETKKTDAGIIPPNLFSGDEKTLEDSSLA